MFKHFKPLDPGIPATMQLYGERIKNENKNSKAKALLVHNFGALKAKGEEPIPMKGVKSYLCRDIIGTHEDTDVLFIPDEYRDVMIETSRVLRDLGLPVVPKDQIIGVPLPPEADEAKEEVIAPSICNMLDETLLKHLYITYISPYMHTKPIQEIIDVHQLGADRKSDVPTMIAENKCIAIEEMARRGVVVPRGFYNKTEEEARKSYRECKRMTETVVIKLPFSSSGHGVLRCKSEEEFEELLQLELVQNYIGEDKLGIRIECFEDIISSPGVSFYVGHTPAEDRIINPTEQILLDQIEHDGNIAPVIGWTEKMEIILKEAANWLREIGCHGVNGVDLGIKKDGTPIFMEINPRKPGHYQYNLANHELNGNAFSPWLGGNIHVPQEISLNDFILFLEGHNIFYDPEKKTGVLPANWAGVKEYGKAQVFIMGGSVKTLQEMYEIANNYTHLHTHELIKQNH